MPRSLPYVQTSSREVNQLQQALMRALAPITKPWPLGETITSAQLPTATSAVAHQGYFVKDAGQPERWVICMQKADGSYAWAVVALAP